jgi:hypothetical protein
VQPVLPDAEVRGPPPIRTCSASPWSVVPTPPYRPTENRCFMYSLEHVRVPRRSRRVHGLGIAAAAADDM